VASVRLSAAGTAPLRDQELAAIVRSTAEAIAERTGVRLVSLELDESGVTAELDVPAIAATGFAAELRRVTARWFARKHGAPETGAGSLWGGGGDS
jgi:hypothetical protein